MPPVGPASELHTSVLGTEVDGASSVSQISGGGALELVLPVQRHDGGGGGVPAPFGLRQQHHQLELIAVRVGSVERLGGTMVAFPGERTRLDQLLAGGGKLPNSREFPGKIEATNGDHQASLTSSVAGSC